MPNEFVARKGFVAKNDSTISGSITTTGGLTGSILSASYSVTASYSDMSLSASYATSVQTASYTEYSDLAGISTTAAKYAKPAYFPTGALSYANPYLCFDITTGSLISNPLGLDNITLTPILINKTCKLASMIITMASSTNGVLTRARLGLYTDNGSMLPYQLVKDLTYASTTVSGSLQHIELAADSEVVLEGKSIYWIAVSGDSNLRLGKTAFHNSLLNPLLGVELKNTTSQTTPWGGGNFNYYVLYSNIVNYVTASAGSNTALPSTLSQDSTTYTIKSYYNYDCAILPLLKLVS